MLSLGTASLIATHENTFDTLCAAGATYLPYLAYRNFRIFFANQSDTNINWAAETSSNAVFQGFLTSVANPKIILFLFALMLQLTVHDKGHMGLQVLILLAILKVKDLFINGAIAVLFSFANYRLLSPEPHVNWSSLFSAIVFLAISVIFWIQLITR